MPANKAELLDDLHARWNDFVVCVDSVPSARWTGSADSAGWTVSDHVAHVTAWDQAVTELFRSRTPEQRTLRVSDAAWATGTDAINEEIRQRSIGRPVGNLKAERDSTFSALVEQVEHFSDDDLERSGGEFGLDEDGKCLREVLVGYLGGHYDKHRQYIVALIEG
jgi:hypothetical protein